MRTPTLTIAVVIVGALLASVALPVHAAAFVEDLDIPAGLTGVSSKPYCKKYLQPEDQTNCAVAIFGGGGFLKLRDGFLPMPGVLAAKIGYCGGFRKENFTYMDVCLGRTGHTEVVMVLYDTKKITFDNLLEKYVTIHDATVRGQVKGQLTIRSRRAFGRQFRSVVFTRSQDQVARVTAFQKAFAVNSNGTARMVTEVVAFTGVFIPETGSDKVLLAIRDEAEAKVKETIARQDELFRNRRKTMEEQIKRRRISGGTDEPNVTPLPPPATTDAIMSAMPSIDAALARRATLAPVERNAAGEQGPVVEKLVFKTPRRSNVNGNARSTAGSDYLSELRRNRKQQELLSKQDDANRRGPKP